MKYWNTTVNAANAGMTQDISRIVDALRCAFGAMNDPKPRLLCIGRHDDVLDSCRYEVRIELAPGVTLPVDWGSPEFVSGSIESKGDELEFADRIIKNVCILQNRFEGTYLADVIHDARQRVRRVMADWQTAGHASRLEDVRLAPLKYWHDPDIAQLTVLIEGLDWNLRPAIWDLPKAQDDNIEDLLASVEKSYVRRLERRSELWREGADGSIDRIALNAIARFGDVAEGIVRCATQGFYTLPDGTLVNVVDGHVSIRTNHPRAEWQWQDGCVTVFQKKQIMDTVLKAAKGRPSTALLEHPFLSEDVMMTDATADTDEDGAWSVTVSFDQPTLLFCSISGRVWQR